jgi:subtilase family protein
MFRSRLHRWLLLGLVSGCAGSPSTLSGPVAPRDSGADVAATAAALKPVLPPQDALARGWMPLEATGIPSFLRENPTFDGRGVIIGILDSGLDPSIPGLGLTSTGERKVLDLRDFSGEGAVPLTRAEPQGDSVRIGNRAYRGISRVRGLTAGPMWVGTLAELPLGETPGSDLDGNGRGTDTLAFVVARATDGWVVFADTDRDGSFATERPVHDYLVARETFGYAIGGRPWPLALAANLGDGPNGPTLDLVFDTSSHGSHVAGIASAHDMYGVKGFDGVAPGAFLLGLKIANNAQGGISTTGSMLEAIDYAIRYAAGRRLPLVLNMSFGVGNEAEGAARIDHAVDSVLAAHPDVIFAISAGNDGPGLSTMGFPGSADRAISVGATYPGVFLGGLDNRPDPIAYFSSRGGEVAKPDIVTPGLAYSTVPRWNTGDEQKGGTSMASPHAAGLAALLVSGLKQSGQPILARRVRQALMVTARPVVEATYLDDGTGLPEVGAAWRWLGAGRDAPDVTVRSLPGGTSAAWRVGADSVQAFVLNRPPDAPALRFDLRSSAPWIRPPGSVSFAGGSDTVVLRYDAAALRKSGTYTGVVTGWGPDTLAGPAFRLVNTVVVPVTGDPVVAQLGKIPAGGNGRVFFEAEAGRPFAVATSTGAEGEQVLAYLHEPNGMPYREENGVPAGQGEAAGGYVVDGRDAVPGLWEAVAVAPPFQGADVTTIVRRSPLAVTASRGPDSVTITLDNATGDDVDVQPFIVLVGAERVVPVVTKGSAVQHLRFQVPDWAVHAVVDVTMDRGQWPLFTDFGVTVLDSVGTQLGKSPLNYAFGRLHVNLPGGRAFPAEVALFPGFADPRADMQWTATVSIRLYADSAHVARLDGPEVTVPPAGHAAVTTPMREPPIALGDGFFPLGIVVLPEEDHAWTREVGLPRPTPAISQ